MQAVNRGFYSMQDTVTPPLIGVGYVALIVGLAVVLMRTPLAYGSIALATSIASLPALLAAILLLRRKAGPMDLRTLGISFARVVAASAVMGVIALGVSNIIGRALGLPHFDFTLAAPPAAGAGGGHVSLLRVGLQVAAAIAAGGVAFVAALRALRADELELVMDIIRRRILRRGEVASAPAGSGRE
jgi:peptidoglycan biosynthesis protein MviN/MurJ (putative lipid II flippase)